MQHQSGEIFFSSFKMISSESESAWFQRVRDCQVNQVVKDKDGEDPDGDGADQQPHGERCRRQRAQRRHGEQGGLHSAQPQQEGELYVISIPPSCASS